MPPPVTPEKAVPESSHEVAAGQAVAVADAFREVPGLGRGLPVVVLVKYQKDNTELVQHRTAFIRAGVKNRFAPLLKPLREQKWGGGFAAAFPLEETLEPVSPRWRISGEEVRGYARSGTRMVIAFVDHLGVYSAEDGRLERTIRHPRFKNLHSVAIHPADANRLLVSNSGLDAILELDLADGTITWSWEAWSRGYGVNPFGIHLIDRETPAADRPAVRLVDRQTARERMATAEAPPDGETWGVEVDTGRVDHPLGLEKWLKGAEPNWAGYDSAGRGILASLFVANQVVTIDRDSGAAAVVLNGLSRPHGLIPHGDGYLVSDTRKGVVALLNREFLVERRYDFSTLPLPNAVAAQDGEWLQFTHPIGDGRLLASVDGRRFQVIVWDPEQRLYGRYPFPDSWSVHAVMGY